MLRKKHFLVKTKSGRTVSKHYNYMRAKKVKNDAWTKRGVLYHIVNQDGKYFL